MSFAHSLPERPKRHHSAVTDAETAEQEEAKKGRYIPCIIKRHEPFPEANNKVYLIQADVERVIPLTAERLALNELEKELYQSNPLVSNERVGENIFDVTLTPAAEPYPIPPRYNGLMVMAKPFELKMWCEMPKRSEAPKEIRHIYASEEQLLGDVYWSETETESYDGRSGLPFCNDNKDKHDDTEWEDDEEHESEAGMRLEEAGGVAKSRREERRRGFGKPDPVALRRPTLIRSNATKSVTAYRTSEQDDDSDLEEGEIKEKVVIQHHNDDDFADDERETKAKSRRKTRIA